MGQSLHSLCLVPLTKLLLRKAASCPCFSLTVPTSAVWLDPTLQEGRSRALWLPSYFSGYFQSFVSCESFIILPIILLGFLCVQWYTFVFILSLNFLVGQSSECGPQSQSQSCWGGAGFSVFWLTVTVIGVGRHLSTSAVALAGTSLWLIN